MIDRRKFLKTAGALGAFVLTPLNKIIRLMPSGESGTPPSGGEFYNGLLLLDYLAPIPDFVEPSSTPILDFIDEKDRHNPKVIEAIGENQWFDTIDDLRRNIHFPLYIPGNLPPNMVLLPSYLLNYKASKKVWEARINYGYQKEELLISISARTEFSQPCPVYSILTYPHKEVGDYITDDEYIIVPPQKVTFTPSPGILLPSEHGFTLQWIKKNILYTVFMEFEDWRNNPEKFGSQLIEI